MKAISAVAGRPEERISLRYLTGVRWGLLFSALLLSGIGLATVHSASAELGIDYLPRQAAWIGIGLVLFLVIFSIDHQALAKLSWLIYGVGLASLGLVLAACLPLRLAPRGPVGVRLRVRHAAGLDPAR